VSATKHSRKQAFTDDRFYRPQLLLPSLRKPNLPRKVSRLTRLPRRKTPLLRLLLKRRSCLDVFLPVLVPCSTPSWLPLSQRRRVSLKVKVLICIQLTLKLLQHPPSQSSPTKRSRKLLQRHLSRLHPSP
jgi:hypothetical protein